MMGLAMTPEEDDKQWEEWDGLYAKIKSILPQWGVDDDFGKGDYLVVDDNYGSNSQNIEVHNLKMLDPIIVVALRRLLSEYPGWTIVMSVDVPGKEAWPPMGVKIRKHEIIDGLRREYLPKEYQSLRYFGSRPGTGHD
jgi:hypothetical protein